MNLCQRVPVPGRFLLACAVAAAPFLSFADDATDFAKLDEYVVSATRSPQDPKNTPVAVSVLPLEELELAQVFDLRTALAEQPGVNVVTSGALGSVSSVFIRGGESHQTTFFVDGVRMNDRSALYTSFLGGADLTGVERVEVLRGPQSTLYGSSAMGGVITIDTVRGQGKPEAIVRASGGSFSTYSGSVAATGAQGPLGYSASVAYVDTKNDRPNNAYHQWSYTARLDYTLSPTVAVGATYRGQVENYEEPGSTFYPAPGTVDFKNHLVTVFGVVKPTENFNSRLTLASHQRDYTYTSTWGASPSTNKRKIVDWQNTWSVTDNVELVGGLNYEDNTFAGSGVSYSQDLKAGYLSAVVRPVDTVTLTLGARDDDYETVGNATTWRAAASWRVEPNTKLRASYGTAFTAPSAEDYLGVPSWGQVANPALKPEKSRGWDAGVDHDFVGGKMTASATWFYNRYRDKYSWQIIDWTTYTGQVMNVDRATAQGVELALAARPADRVNTRLAYTYLDARDDTSGTRLIRRPRHTLDFDANVQVTKAWLLGAGVHLVSDRLDSGPVTLPGYTTVRFYTSYALGEKKPVLQLRVENALDRTYEEIAGYPALPVAVYGGLEWRF